MKAAEVVITGAAGFIGSHLAEHLLRAGHDVTGLDNLDPYYAPALKRANLDEVRQTGRSSQGAWRFEEGDIRDASMVEETLRQALARGPDPVVVHLAAKAGVRPSIEDPLAYQDVNGRGTWTMLEACRRLGIKRVVLASSSSVYGVSPDVPFREDAPVGRPISPYAATKRANELAAHTFAHLFGLRCICLRFFTVYGPRQRPDLAIHKFTRLISEGAELPVFGDGRSRRDYTYVDDIVQGVAGAVEWTGRVDDGSYEIVNLGESRTVQLSELINLLEKALGREARINRLPDQPGDVPQTYASVEKARRLLEYQPSVDIEDGIPRFVAWFRDATTPRY